jgi:hypothetical protein
MSRLSSLTNRPMTFADRSFVLATWLRGQRFGHPYYTAIDKKSYYTNYSKYIESILSLHSTRVLVACLADEPDVIVGYAVYSSSGALHWVYTKKAWRNLGVARSLLPSPIRAFTGLTVQGAKLATALGAVFDPFAI